MTRLRALLLVPALCILLPALALPPQTPAPLKTAAPPAAPKQRHLPQLHRRSLTLSKKPILKHSSTV